MEQQITIPTPDHKTIYGALRTSEETPSKKLVIFLHGLTHSHIHYPSIAAADYFPTQGYDYFAFSFYFRMKDARSLPDVTLTTQTQDLQTVLAHFREHYDQIYVIGHSLGATTALIANPDNITALSFWDPALDVTNFWKTTDPLTPVPERHEYHLDYGNVFVLGADMIAEIAQFPNEKCLALAKKVTTPTQFVIPEESIFLASPHTSPEEYNGIFAGPFEITSIKKANHTFTYEGNADKLFSATIEWFNRFS